MCLIALAWHSHPRWPLVLLGNRDELHERPTEPLQRWSGKPAMLAGRDRRAGGTWMGLGESGRAAVVTNVRDPSWHGEAASRGFLVRDYLQGADDALAYANKLLENGSDYRPFNLLLFDADQCVYIGNHPQPHMQRVAAGVHGLSNADFNTPWPKTRQLTSRLAGWVARAGEDEAALWNALTDDSTWPDDVLPDTGVGLALERRLSAAFIRGQEYGTRASTLILVDPRQHGLIIERRFGPRGTMLGQSRASLPDQPTG